MCMQKKAKKLFQICTYVLFLPFFIKRLEESIESPIELEIGGGEVPVVGFFGIGKEGTHSAVNSARGRITPIQLSSIANPIN